MARSTLLALALVSIISSLVKAYAPCPIEQSEMSVEGVEGIFCVAESPICTAEISNGECPTIQEGLPYGSYCGVVASGVYGCKTLDANSILTFAPAMTPAPSTVNATETPTPSPTNTPTSATPVPTTARPGCDA